jgi:hypothetical protein
MGYDLHITRAKDWTDAEQKPITLDEWKSGRAQDPEFEVTGLATAQVENGKILEYESEALAEWSGYSAKYTVWIDYCEGRIVVKNPDEEIIQKTKEVAQYLDAYVLGDEGELY